MAAKAASICSQQPVELGTVNFQVCGNGFSGRAEAYSVQIEQYGNRHRKCDHQKTHGRSTIGIAIGLEMDFSKHKLLRPTGFGKAVSSSHESPRLPAPLAHYRPRYPSWASVPAKPESVSPGIFSVPIGNVRCKSRLYRFFSGGSQ